MKIEETGNVPPSHSSNNPKPTESKDDEEKKCILNKDKFERQVKNQYNINVYGDIIIVKGDINLKLRKNVVTKIENIKNIVRNAPEDELGNVKREHFLDIAKQAVGSFIGAGLIEPIEKLIKVTENFTPVLINKIQPSIEYIKNILESLI